MEQKNTVLCLQIALASLFDHSVSTKYHAEVDKALEDTDLLGSDLEKISRKQRKTMRSIQELGKLGSLMGE